MILQIILYNNYIQKYNDRIDYIIEDLIKIGNIDEAINIVDDYNQKNKLIDENNNNTRLTSLINHIKQSKHIDINILKLIPS